MISNSNFSGLQVTEGTEPFPAEGVGESTMCAAAAAAAVVEGGLILQTDGINMTLVEEHCPLRWAVAMWMGGRHHEPDRAPVIQKYGRIENWNTSQVTDMSFLFYYGAGVHSVNEFNEDIRRWDVSSVKTTAFMFKNTIFDQDISDWDTGNV